MLLNVMEQFDCGTGSFLVSKFEHKHELVGKTAMIIDCIALLSSNYRPNLSNLVSLGPCSGAHVSGVWEVE